jgi:hypothetical protein
MLFDKKNNDNESINIPIISESSGRVHITVDDPTSVSSANKNEFNDERPEDVQNL